jgi:hypothetical protein
LDNTVRTIRLFELHGEKKMSEGLKELLIGIIAFVLGWVCDRLFGHRHV